MNAHHVRGSADLRRGAAVAALVAAGLLHAFIAPEYLHEKLYVGLLFAVSVPLCLGVATWLTVRDDRLAWVSGALLCGGMLAGFLMSRTVGLPGFNESGVWAYWTEGFPALTAELGFLALAARSLLRADPVHVGRAAPAQALHRDSLS
jgi:hypothetical protein